MNTSAKPMIHYKVAVVVDGVMIAHECGITDTSIKDLLSYPGLHPDLVEVAMTSLKTMARKYNGASDVQEQTTDEGNKVAEANANEAGQSGNADEKAG